MSPRTHKSSSHRVPPGPRAVHASVTNALALGRNPLGFLSGLARDYGSVSSFQIGRRRLYFFTSPEAAREILATHAAIMRKGYVLRPVWDLLSGILGRGMALSEGALHERQRRLAAPAFHGERLHHYVQEMARIAQGYLQQDRWRDGAVLDLATELRGLTLMIVGQTLFGTDLGKSAAAFREALAAMMLPAQNLCRSPAAAWLDWLPFSPNACRARAGRKRLERIVTEMIAAKRQTRTGAPGADLLSRLLAAHDEGDGAGPDDEQLRHEVMTLLLAGHETTAGTLAWAIWLLTQHPQIEAQVRAEVDAILGRRGAPEFEDLPKLRMIRAVLLETLRLYPAAYLLIRQATAPVVIGGWPVPAGTTCLLSPYIMHRDEKIWPEPDRFDPGRWRGAEDKPAMACKGAYLPFGAGPRSCIGEAFAWAEATLLLAMLLQSFRLSPVPDRPGGEPFALVTLTLRDGLWLRVHRRAIGEREISRGQGQGRTCGLG